MLPPPVSPEFFLLPTPQLARALLGTLLVHQTPEGPAAGVIVEVEMYRGPWDKGAHSYGGRRTRRTEVMYGPPGHAYVYRIYGMHHCLNVVAAPEGAPEAILVRALEPVAGLPLMAARRGLDPRGVEDASPRALRALASGPGRLCQAMGISLAQYGAPLWRPPLYVCHYRDPVPAHRVAQGPRIGIDYAEEARFYPWRFWISDNAFVSVKGSAAHAPPGEGATAHTRG